MADRVKGITIEFNGDTSKLNKALKDIRKEANAVDSELKQVDRLLKFNPKNTELLTQKQTLLKKKVEDTKQSLTKLKNTQKQLDEKNVDKNSEAYRRVQREIIEAESKLKHFEAEAKKLENIKLTKLSKQVEDVGKKMEDTGKKMTKNITLPLVAGMTASVKTGMDFDKAMSQVAATMGKTTDEIQELRDFAIETGSTTAFTMTEAAEGLNYMALAGYSAEESMRMLPLVLNLAAAGAMDLATASDLVTKSQNALSLTAEETEVLIDQMATTASTTGTSVQELGEAILTVGGTAKMMKGGTAELVAVLGLLADNGMNASEGGTSLRNILKALSSPTSKAKKELDALGVAVYDAEGNMRSIEDIMMDFNKSMDGMTTEEKNRVITNIFNPRDLKAINALLGTTADRWDEVNSAIANAEGSAEKMAETQLDNLSGSITILLSALQGMAVAIADVLSPAVRKFADLLNGAVTRFNNLSPTTQKLIVGIAVAVAAIGPALTIAGKALQFFGTVLQNVGKIMGAVSKAMTFLAANPVVLIIAGIVALVAAFVILWKKSEAFREFWINLWTAIKTFVLNTWTAITTAFSNAWARIKGIWAGVASWFSGRWAAIKAVFAGVASWFGSVFGSAWSAIKQRFAGWGEFWSGLWQSVKNKFSDIGSAVGNAIHNAITGGLNAVIAKVESIINKGISLINKGIGLINKVKLGKDIGYLEPLSLPRLAEGGVLNHARAVVAGEAGPEAIIPLDKLFGQMDKMADTIAGAGQGVVINVYGSDGMSVTELAAAVERRLIAAQNRRRLAW